MSFAKTYEQALATHKPMKRSVMRSRSGNPKPRKRMKPPSTPLKKVSAASALKNRVWTEFSIFIRRRDAAREYVVCVTCWSELHWKDAHAGHFVAGRGNSVLFDERNCHPQCAHCNINLTGNPSAYEQFMRERYGQKVIDELKTQRDKTVKWLPDELKSLLTHYRRINQGGK